MVHECGFGATSKYEMFLSELFEARKHLPLSKGVISAARDGYGAFVCVMHPMDFLRLTCHEDDGGPQGIIDEIKRTDKIEPPTLDSFVNNTGRMQVSRYPSMAFLNVRLSDGKVRGHEGRHRAALVHLAGGDKYSCIIYPRNDDFHTVSWEEDDERKSEEFVNDSNAAYARQEFLKNERDEDGYLKRFRVDVDYSGGGSLKGAPARSSGWDRAAWTVEDFPKQLIGQFPPHEIVTRFRVGLVKGYRHFTK